jgi:hypothetical protein
MTWEGVPWMVAGGEHSAEVGRLLAFAAISGGEGVASPSDCKVVASAIPDGNIHIQPGAVGVLNRFPGGSSQAYLLRNIGDEVEAMTPQGSSGVRYDLVAVIVEDPQYPGQPAPPSIPDGPYLRTVVYEDVASTVTSLAEVDADQSGYALARVKFDASDGTVTNADITDLRRLLMPRSQRFLRSTDNAGGVALTSAAYVTWPPAPAVFNVDVPPWATHATIICHLSGVVNFPPQMLGGMAIKLGTLMGPNVGLDLDPVDSSRISWSIPADLVISPEMRGTTQQLSLQAFRQAGFTGTLNTWAGSSTTFDVNFTERPL